MGLVMFTNSKTQLHIAQTPVYTEQCTQLRPHLNFATGHVVLVGRHWWGGGAGKLKSQGMLGEPDKPAS